MIIKRINTEKSRSNYTNRLSIYEIPQESKSNSSYDEEFLAVVINQLPTQRLKTIARRYYLEGLSIKTIAHQLFLDEEVVTKCQQWAYNLMQETAKSYATV